VYEIKVGDIVKYSLSPLGSPLYGIVIDEEWSSPFHLKRYTVKWFNGAFGRGPLGYRISNLIKVSDGP